MRVRVRVRAGGEGESLLAARASPRPRWAAVRHGVARVVCSCHSHSHLSRQSARPRCSGGSRSARRVTGYRVQGTWSRPPRLWVRRAKREGESRGRKPRLLCTLYPAPGGLGIESRQRTKLPTRPDAGLAARPGRGSRCAVQRSAEPVAPALPPQTAQNWPT